MISPRRGRAGRALTPSRVGPPSRRHRLPTGAAAAPPRILGSGVRRQIKGQKPGLCFQHKRHVALVEFKNTKSPATDASAAPGSGTPAIAERKLAIVEEKLADLNAMHDALTDLISACRRGGRGCGCPLIDALASDES